MDDRESRLREVACVAVALEAQTGCPPQLLTAQWAVESKWGAKPVGQHNYFGIKATDLTNPEHYIEFRTPEYVDGKRVIEEAEFARYEDAAESFDAHGRLLATARRYAPAMAVRSDPTAFAAQLQHGGYSTSPTYASSLWRAIQNYDLAQYDLPPDGGAAQAGA